MKMYLLDLLILLNFSMLFTAPVFAQHAEHASSVVINHNGEQTQDQAKSTYSPPPGWPSPVDDSTWHSFVTAELFEYRNNQSKDARWDIFGWYGGDYERFWFKTEGAASTEATSGTNDIQLLYGKLISRYFDLQLGVRNEQIWESGEAVHSESSASIGFQGLAPYYFDIEPTIFVTDSGAFLGRFTGVYDIQLSQRLILQPRVEFSLSSESSEEFKRGSGLTDSEISLRLRYEINRKLAPYIGVTFEKVYGRTADYAELDGDRLSEWMFVTGVRWWL